MQTRKMRAATPLRAWAVGLCLGFACLIGAGVACARGGPVEPLSAFPQSLLAIRTAAGRVIDFKIWLADTPRRDQQGLMYVRDMGDHAGMLFLFSGADPIDMWMKNTIMPLDMLFIDARGKITRIARRRTPLSLTLIPAPRRTRAVLELKGGICDRFGIRSGDRVLNDLLTPGH
ncbi:MAG TPA: DUF192 domain-containing protein [Steroidobacteraceae bacterium]|nr:DUF192 domain-containing protein [Steroidobacteraceae bacterium]